MWLSGWSQRGGLEVKVRPLGCWWLKFSGSCSVEWGVVLIQEMFVTGL